jgi:hypothetical protein
MTSRTKTWLWSACGVYFVVKGYQDFRRATPESRFQGYFAILIAGFSFYCAFKSNRGEVTLIVPKTKIARIGWWCLLPCVPLILNNIWNRLTGARTDYLSGPGLILGVPAMVGFFFACVLVWFDIIRSAWRK